jgi:hypothetical protein
MCRGKVRMDSRFFSHAAMMMSSAMPMFMEHGHAALERG